MATNKMRVAMAILIVCLVLSLGYIAFGQYQARTYQTQLSAFQGGAQYGYEQAVMQLAEQASTCQQVPIMVQNQTINIIAVECLQ